MHSKKVQNIIASIKKTPTFATAIARDSTKTMKWCGSSAWLEYMPVTHGVAGSSPVRTAINIKNQCFAN